jgi:MFS transporter, OFA family, oxalate/formate antiporter
MRRSFPAVERGWVVVGAATMINLMLGVLYSWSIIADSLTRFWGWSAAAASVPYALAIGVFATMMVFAGRAQDTIGPRVVASVGGVLVGLGLLTAGLVSPDNRIGIIIGFGLLAGAGIGLGYSSTTPPALKWFPPAKKGLISGIVVSGFGLAALYIAPLTQALLNSVGVSRTFFLLGAGFFTATVLLSQLLGDPPPGFVPRSGKTAPSINLYRPREHDWHEMVKTKQFYLLWAMFAFASFAGVMVIGHMAKIASQQLPGVNLGFFLVAVLAVGNASGRFAAGAVSDSLGRTRTMLVVFLGQALILALFTFADTASLLAIGAFLIGFNYGANLALFPSVTADYFGTRNLGINYGLLVTAWGAGGIVGSMSAGAIVDTTGSYNLAFTIATALMLVAAVLTFFTREPHVPTAESTPLEQPP